MNLNDLSASLAKIEKFLESSKNGQTQPVEITLWFKHDYWIDNEGILLLMGLEPSGTIMESCENIFGEKINTFRLVRFLGGREVDLTAWEVRSHQLSKQSLSACEMASLSKSDETLVEIERLNTIYQQMKEVWFSGNHCERNDPNYYINWAKDKEYNIGWYEWALKHQLIKPLNEAPEDRQIRLKNRVNQLRGMGVVGFFKKAASEEEISPQRLRAIIDKNS